MSGTYRPGDRPGGAGLAVPAHAPSARCSGFASFGRFTAGVVGDCGVRFLWSLTTGFVGDHCNVSGAQSDAAVAETAGGLWVDGQAGADADEVADQLGVAADEAELAAELLLWIGHVTRGPSPLPVREAAV
jgi:hypothetical protein